MVVVAVTSLLTPNDPVKRMGENSVIAPALDKMTSSKLRVKIILLPFMVHSEIKSFV